MGFYEIPVDIRAIFWYFFCIPRALNKFQVIWMFNNEHHVRLIQFPSNPINNDIVYDVILIIMLRLRCNHFLIIIKTFYFHPFIV